MASRAVVPISPVDTETGVSKATDVIFKITGDGASSIVLSTVVVYSRAEIIYNGLANEFEIGWRGSSYVANAEFGFTFTLDPDRRFYWRRGEVVKTRVIAENALSESVDTSWEFTASQRTLPNVYGMLIQSVRTKDETR